MRLKALAIIAVTAALATVLAACATPAEQGGAPACPETRGWTAFINAMPGPGAVPTLIVTGEANLPAGRTATIVIGPTDRMMPPGQRFTLSLAPSSAPSGWQEVRAEIKPALSAYSSVIIGCEGQEVARITDIQTAH